jgi:membrane associated rhomboid family serine protease
MIPLRDSQPSRTVPAVTVLLIALNVAVFFHEAWLDDFSRNHFIHRYGVVPDSFRWPTLFSSMFLHGGWMHLIGNMWFLWIFGDNVEDVLGKWRYTLFYLASGVAAGLVHLLANSESRIPTVGASGAIAGVMGAYLLKFPNSTIKTVVFIIIFVQVVDVPAFWMLIYWLVIQVLSGVGEIGRNSVNEGGVAWFAHVGGFLAGMALIKLFHTEPKYRRYPEYHW